MKAQTIATSDHTFLTTLQSWIQNTQEILVLIRYSHCGGSKSFEFFSSFKDLAGRIQELPPLTSVIAFRQHQLPLRGIVSDAFIAECLELVPNGQEYLIVEQTRRTYGAQSWFHFDSGESHENLRENLQDLRDAHVAFGVYPDWFFDNDDVISAVVPDPSGSVRVGVY